MDSESVRKIVTSSSGLYQRKRYLSMSPMRPPLPYAKGLRFTVQSHIPTPRTPVVHSNLNYTLNDLEDLVRLDPVEFFLAHPLLPGEIGSNTLGLEIIDTIKVKEPCNSQVFTVKVLKGAPEKPLPASNILIAKVYDPLYYNDVQFMIAGYRAMDRFYTHETRVYSVLSEFQGENIPHFYGSYSFDIPIENSSNVRSVRLILIGYLPEKDMQKAQPATCSQEARQQIMKNIVDFESTVFFKNIVLRDCCPRNIILLQDHDNTISVKFIDFDAVLFNRRPQHPFRAVLDKDKFLGQYITPLYRWRRPREDFEDWVDWDWKPWLDAEFAHTASKITPEIRGFYEPKPDEEKESN
ncbi:uncharacterized protein N7483_010229 [Penicillium malachiteum]|uniref:uncharacterized protein n=1 Tax=Penicillium malachiteum TaxID=1324776 RepID=UPI002548A1D1|nr:uncharacterized protein N7483_010229 [Penicillium malachiteum]KAJ5713048.1 hypothetical protein N7483_010229 [Penicillium malachiteum]